MTTRRVPWNDTRTLRRNHGPHWRELIREAIEPREARERLHRLARDFVAGRDDADGQRLLEVGVVAGTDHLRFARAGAVRYARRATHLLARLDAARDTPTAWLVPRDSRGQMTAHGEGSVPFIEPNHPHRLISPALGVPE